MYFRFITSTRLDTLQGSGTAAGINTLAKFLRLSGASVDLITPTLRCPVYTVERFIFNERLRWSPPVGAGVTVGFDMDGYAVSGCGCGLHIASIKGVIADESRFEGGLTRATMRLQALGEKHHVRRADLVITTSRYASERIQELYRVSVPPRVVPELIDLTSWRRLLKANPAQPPENKFVVLSVCRFYPRKRLHVLLDAVDRLRSSIPELEVRIVGDGPEALRLKSICRKKRLQGFVTWLGNLSSDQVASEYNRCHVFCLPSVQEGFGIVFLEAMASAKPVVAARAGAAPEVVKHGILVEPEDDEALSEALRRLHADPALRRALAAEGSLFVQQFDAPLVIHSFLQEVEIAAGTRPTVRTGPRPCG
jgi:glycosyltransferase involved in cell wall biosynthesis